MKPYFERNSHNLTLRYAAGVSWPRSGHHLLVRLLQGYFGPEFGYCEFYGKEIDCCRKFPCERRVSKIILSKNHDVGFKLEPVAGTPMIVQLRAALPSIISNYELAIGGGFPDNPESFQRFAREQSKSYARFRQKWVENALPCESLVVWYEDLVGQTEQELARVLEFLSPGMNIDNGRITASVNSVDGQRIEKGQTTLLRKVGVHASRDVSAFRYYDADFFADIEAETGARAMSRPVRTGQSRAILHIGDEKAGSTHFQTFLNQNKSWLAENGLSIMKASRVGNYDMGLAACAGHKGFRMKFMEKWNMSGDENAFYTAFQKEFEEERARLGRHDVVFSFEGLIRLEKRQISKLASFLRTYFEGLDVVAILRRQDLQSISAYSTRLTNAGAVDRDPLYRPNGKPWAKDYHAAMALWGREVGFDKLKVLRYEDLSSVTGSILEAVGMPPPAVDGARNNQSISAYGQEIIRRFNEAFQEDARFAPFSKHFTRLRRNVGAAYPGTSFLPARRDAERFYAQFRAGNRKLASLLDLPRESFFDEDFSVYPEKPAPISVSDDEVVAAFTDALRRLSLG